MLGKRAEIAAVPGVRNAASGTGPPRGAARKAVEVGPEGKEVMSCSRMENKIMGFVDGRLKEGERLEMEKHLALCAACQLRVNEFRSVHALLDELPMIEPSAAFDLRGEGAVRAAAEWSAERAGKQAAGAATETATKTRAAATAAESAKRAAATAAESAKRAAEFWREPSAKFERKSP